MHQTLTIKERLIGLIRGSLPWATFAAGVGWMLGGLRERNFLILSSARSGSNLLVDYLRGDRRITCRGEILNDNYHIYGSMAGKSENRKRLHVRSLFAKLPRLPCSLPPQFVGAKLLIDQFGPASLPFSCILQDLGHPHILVLFRIDMLETYVSLEIALRNKRWYSTQAVNAESIEINWNSFVQYCEDQRVLWRTALAEAGQQSCELHFLDYDSLVSEPGAVVRKALRFIGLQSNCEPVQKSVRQNPWPLSRKIVNYADLEKQTDFHAGFRYLKLFEEFKGLKPLVVAESR